jgi:hypothetical protein
MTSVKGNCLICKANYSNKDPLLAGTSWSSSRLVSDSPATRDMGQLLLKVVPPTLAVTVPTHECHTWMFKKVDSTSCKQAAVY